jgi:hypothetical protein
MSHKLVAVNEEDGTADLSHPQDYAFRLEKLKSNIKLAIEKYDLNSDGIIDEGEMVKVLERAVQDKDARYKLKRLAQLLGAVSVFLVLILTLMVVLTVQLSKETTVDGDTLTSSSTGNIIECGMPQDTYVQLDNPYYGVETIIDGDYQEELTVYMCGTVECKGLKDFLDSGYMIVASQTAEQFNDQMWRILNSGTRSAMVDISTVSEGGTDVETRPFDCSGYSPSSLDKDLVAFTAIPQVPQMEDENYILFLPRECYNTVVEGCLSPIVQIGLHHFPDSTNTTTNSSATGRRRRLNVDEKELTTNISHVQTFLSCDDAALVFGTSRKIPVKVILNGKVVVLTVRNTYHGHPKGQSEYTISANVGLHTYVSSYMGVSVDASIVCPVSPFENDCDMCSLTAELNYLDPLAARILESHTRRFRR